MVYSDDPRNMLTAQLGAPLIFATTAKKAPGIRAAFDESTPFFLLAQFPEGAEANGLPKNSIIVLQAKKADELSEALGWLIE